jgi:two-component system cell cycle sensor histidine kinase/response regulator CckA
LNDESRGNVGQRRTVLLVDDDPMQLKLGCLRLTDAGFAVKAASGPAEGLRIVCDGGIDAIVSDVLMDELDGFAFCQRVRSQPALEAIPVLLVSAHFSGEADRQLAASAGASALVLRTPTFAAELAALRSVLGGEGPPAPFPSDTALLFERHVRNSSRQISRLIGEARSARERYRALFESSPEPIAVLSTEGLLLEVNRGMQDLMQLPAEAMVGQHISEFAAPGTAEENVAAYRKMMEKGSGWTQAVPLRRQDGATLLVEFMTTLIEDEGERVVLAIGHDVTEKVHAAKALDAAEHKYRSMIERMPDVVWTASADGRTTFVTPNIERVIGYTPAEIYAGGPAFWVEGVHPEHADITRDAFTDFMTKGKLFDIEYRFRHKDGRWLWLRNHGTATYEQGGVVHADGTLSDVTQRRQLEDSLRQAQKMEAIGQLTGGIAHDFNNMLAAVIANTHFLVQELAVGDPRRTDAEEIRTSAERAAALTRQLLAFSRRQVLQPAILDLNGAMSGLEKMLRRLIGEDIDLQICPTAGLGAVSADAGQIEQVIMNLVVNARDAMPSGGRLTIETANVTLDERHSTAVDPVVAGEYVMLAVSDNGCGMTPETKKRLFEPFFTTKEVGKGTGLGLSTCYGIVRQSGGHIWADSELGRGTVFKIYLPRVDAQPAEALAAAESPSLNGKETVLVVEDDDRVRTAVIRMLAARGYRVLPACDGWEAVGVARTHDGPIHLIVSDVVMPGCNGPEMVQTVQMLSPTTRALFMSGYTDHAVLRHEALRSGLNFIQKPFAPDMLARKVRDVLDI